MFARFADSLPPQLLLVTSRALQALATPIIALLISTAAGLGAEVQSAISFCNVLFIGNLCASLLVASLFGPRRIAHELRELSALHWLEVLVFAGLAALLSTLIFLALRTTSVTNAVLLARLGPVLYALAAALLIGPAIRRNEWLGFGFIGVGLLCLVFVGSGFEVRQGDILILCSAVVYTLVTLLSRHLLGQTDLPALVFARNFFSTLIFCAIALVLFGPHHFMDAFYGPLWVLMAVYALVVIVASQFLWYRSIGVLAPASVARWTVMTPALAMSYAFFLNGEHPSASQLVALALVSAGLLVSALGRRNPPAVPESAEGSVAAA